MSFSTLIHVASGKQQADIVIRNGQIVNVFTGEILQLDVAIHNGQIVGLGQYEGKTIIDAAGKYIVPGLIDSHIHIESTVVPPSTFAEAIVPHGVLTTVTDPHEIANVAGELGIQFLLDDSENIPHDVMFMLPSCVPATEFEHAGATLHAEQLAPFFNHPRVIGLAEVMDFPAVLNAKEDMLNKIETTLAHGAIVDGHMAGLDAQAVNVYRTAQIKTDHECINVEEALERIRRGMYVLIREGSVAKDLHALLPVINERTSRRLLFCTDDKHLDELIEEGTIDHCIRLAVKAGVDPITAIQIATLNAAECYQLKNKGAIAPGYVADFLFVDDLHNFAVTDVYKAGQLVAQHGKALFSTKESIVPTPLLTSVRPKPFTAAELQIPLTAPRANVIGIVPNSLQTRHLVEDVDVVNGYFAPSVEKDFLKIVVVERHHARGLIGTAIVKGFGIQHGAIATTIAHDSHNMIVAGTDDASIMRALAELEAIQGGMVVCTAEETLAAVPLAIGGLLSTEPLQTVLAQLHDLHGALHHIGAADDFHPFVTLAFLALPVIPELKLTDSGLFSFSEFKHIPVQA